MANRKLVMQIQPELLPQADTAQLLEAVVLFLNGLACHSPCKVSREGQDGYVNITVQAENIPLLWAKIRSECLNGGGFSAMAKGLIVVCEGDEGWADYLLLHHYDPSEHVDSLHL